MSTSFIWWLLYMEIWITRNTLSCYPQLKFHTFHSSTSTFFITNVLVFLQCFLNFNGGGGAPCFTTFVFLSPLISLDFLFAVGCTLNTLYLNWETVTRRAKITLFLLPLSSVVLMWAVTLQFSIPEVLCWNFWSVLMHSQNAILWFSQSIKIFKQYLETDYNNCLKSYTFYILVNFHFLAVQVIFICVYITNYLHIFTMFLSF